MLIYCDSHSIDKQIAKKGSLHKTITYFTILLNQLICLAVARFVAKMPVQGEMNVLSQKVNEEK